MTDAVIKILFALTVLTALFWGGLFLWELLVRFVLHAPDLSILFDRYEE